MFNLFTPKRVLPANVFDALEFSVEASGGKVLCGGSGCLLAHAAFLDGLFPESKWMVEYAVYNAKWSTKPQGKATPVLTAVYKAFQATSPDDVYEGNDQVCSVNGQTWSELVEKMSIVRARQR